MDNNIGFDDSDLLPGVPFTRFVEIKGDGLENAIIDVGIDAVTHIYDMAEKNEISYAESIQLDYYANCDITFKGKNLLRFLKENYPDKLQEFEDKVNTDADYTLMCLDFS